MPEDPDEFASRPGCFPALSRRFPRVRRRIFERDDEDDEDALDEEEDLDVIDDLEDAERISPFFAGCLRVAVIVGGICVFTLLGFLGIDIGDSVKTRLIKLDVEFGTTTTTVTPPSDATGPPTVASILGGYIHGANRFKTPSIDQVCAVIIRVPIGAEVQFFGNGNEGVLTVQGTVGAGGRVLAEGGISQLGTKTFDQGVVTDPETGASQPVQLSPPLAIDVADGANKPCDPSTLPAAPSEAPENDNQPPVEEPTTAQTETITVETDGFPWSIVVAAGLDVLLLAFAFGGSTRRGSMYPDWEDSTYPDWDERGVSPSAAGSDPIMPPATETGNWDVM